MDKNQIVRELYKTIIDKAIELDVVVDGLIIVEFSDKTLIKLKFSKDA